MPNLSPNLPPDIQRKMLRQMLTIRRFEERASADYIAGKIYGVVHCYIGEEAVAVGVCSALDRADQIISHPPRPRPLHRQGRRPEPHDGRALRAPTGYCKGKGGSMHIADFGIGMLGANGIVGGGIADRRRRRRSPRRWKANGGVAVAFFGDGASNPAPSTSA